MLHSTLGKCRAAIAILFACVVTIFVVESCLRTEKRAQPDQDDVPEHKVNEAWELAAPYEDPDGLEAVSHNSETYEIVTQATGKVIEVVWQRPSGYPVGTLFLAHGCSHSATDFWDRSAACPTCIGLPEEKKIVAEALAAGLVTIAVSSNDRDQSRCWSPDVDGPRIRDALSLLRQREGLMDLPLFALGASSGGAMVANLPYHVRDIAAVVSMIMAVPANAVADPDAGGKTYPPLMLMHMPRDNGMATGVELAAEELLAMKRQVEVVPIPPLPVDPHFFSRRISGISKAASEAIFLALEDAGLLDPQFYLTQDPRGGEWRNVLQPLVQSGVIIDDSLEADRSAISEELNVAWASHEISSDFMDAVLAFFSKVALPTGRQDASGFAIARKLLLRG